MDTPTFPHPGRMDADDLPGHSPPMLALRAAITRLAHERAPVLIHGEAGSGKECVARQLHRQSGRAASDFLMVPGLTVEPALLDRLPAAGSLFIDAVEDLSASAQSALLHWLQAGAHATRLITASTHDGPALAANGRLRPDLVNHLGALRLAVPPLRERREDLPALLSLFLAEFGAGRELRLDDAAATAVVLHDWPGNLRELRNRLSQAVLLADTNLLTPDMLGLVPPGRPNCLTLREMRQAAEREAITRALRKCQGQVPAAASILGISRAQLYRLISRLKLDHHAVGMAQDLPARPPSQGQAPAKPDPSDPARIAAP